MPISGYEWLPENKFNKFFYDWKYWTGNEKHGFILEVDLTYVIFL